MQKLELEYYCYYELVKESEKLINENSYSDETFQTLHLTLTNLFSRLRRFCKAQPSTKGFFVVVFWYQEDCVI